MNNVQRPEAQQILAHELFHILSRCNSALRDALYSNMNFVKCNSIELPPSLFKITNPGQFSLPSSHLIRCSIQLPLHPSINS